MCSEIKKFIKKQIIYLASWNIMIKNPRFDDRISLYYICIFSETPNRILFIHTKWLWEHKKTKFTGITRLYAQFGTRRWSLETFLLCVDSARYHSPQFPENAYAAEDADSFTGGSRNWRSSSSSSAAAVTRRLFQEYRKVSGGSSA